MVFLYFSTVCIHLLQILISFLFKSRQNIVAEMSTTVYYQHKHEHKHKHKKHTYTLYRDILFYNSMQIWKQRHKRSNKLRGKMSYDLKITCKYWWVFPFIYSANAEGKLSVAKDGACITHTVFVFILWRVINCRVCFGISDKHIF